MLKDLEDAIQVYTTDKEVGRVLVGNLALRETPEQQAYLRAQETEAAGVKQVAETGPTPSFGYKI